MFAAGQKVDVTGTTIGKGFRRHDEAPQLRGRPGLPRRLGVPPRRPARSASARRRDACFRASACPATWATCAAPSRNLRVVEIDTERNLLLIRGAVPGSPGGEVIVRPSLKAARRAKRKTLAPKQPAAKTKK
jgi:large subunit ribosomal protein L3